MINPDNFIFHSDWWYPTNVVAGRVHLDKRLPMQEPIADISDGDYFKVWYRDQFSNSIVSSSPYDKFNYYAQGGKLWVAKAPQFGGASFSGDFYYRIYKKDNVFLLNADRGRCEITAKSLNGTANLQAGVNSTIVELPVDIDGELLLRGTFRYQGSLGILDSTVAGVSVFAEYRFNEKKVRLTINRTDRVFLNGEFIQYSIQLVKAVDDHPWVFHSDKYSFVLPNVMHDSVPVRGTVPARNSLILRGETFTTPGVKQAYDYSIRHTVNDKWQSSDSGMMTNNGLAFGGYLDVQHDSVTPIIEIRNETWNNVWVDNAALEFRIFQYQNNIS